MIHRTIKNQSPIKIEMGSSSAHTANAFISKIVSDNKVMTEEMNVQLKLIEDLRNEKLLLTKQLNKCQREMELCTTEILKI